MTRQSLAHDADVADVAALDFYEHLLAGDFSAILDSFEGEPNIDAPRSGPVAGRNAVERFLEEELSWLEGLGASIDGLRQVKETSSLERTVQEVGIQLPIPPVVRPIMFAAVTDLGMSGIRAIRLYYSYGFLSGAHEFLRAAMLPADPGLIDEIPPAVRTYVDSIAAADFNVWKLFAHGGSLMGVPSVPYRGCKLVRFFAIAMAEDGGVPLQPVTVTSDNTTCAIEENLDSWGSIQFERSTAGLAVYDYDDSAHITAARIYDDIPVNPFSKPGLVYENWELISSRITGAGCEIPFVPTAQTTPLEIKKKLLF